MRGAICILACSLAAGCGAAPGKQVQEDLATMREERSVDKLVARARAFASVGDSTRAEQYFSAALESGADTATVLPDLLRVCIEAKRFRVAIAYAAPWLERHPGDTKLRFVVAALRASIGDATGAQADFARILVQEPDDATVHFAYAILLRDQLGSVTQADGEFREYLRLEPRGPHVEEAFGSLLKVVP